MREFLTSLMAIMRPASVLICTDGCVSEPEPRPHLRSRSIT